MILVRSSGATMVFAHTPATTPLDSDLVILFNSSMGWIAQISVDCDRLRSTSRLDKKAQ